MSFTCTASLTGDGQDKFSSTYTKVNKWGKSELPLHYKEIAAYNEDVNTNKKNFVMKIQTVQEDDF